MNLLFKLTTRSRPHRASEVIKNIMSFIACESYHIMVTVDDDDTTVGRIYRPMDDRAERVTFISGTSKNKVDAINRDVERAKNWDVLINVSDDQLFTVRGFDQIIVADIYEHGKDVFLHYPDGNAKDRLSTMSIMGCDYYNRFGYIYHPDYVSLWCDNEAMEVAKILGCYHYNPTQIFEHYHPAYGKGKTDDQYRKTESYFYTDKQTYLKRKANNFDL